MAKEIQVCGDCTAGLANADWSHLDYDQDDEVGASIAAFVEELGLAPYVGEGPSDSYYRCPCCGMDAIGGGLWKSDN